MDKKIEDYLPLYDELVEKALAEEKLSYQNDLVPFEQHATQIREQIYQNEKTYLERMRKAVQLLNQHFGKQEKLTLYIKI